MLCQVKPAGTFTQGLQLMNYLKNQFFFEICFKVSRGSNTFAA